MTVLQLEVPDHLRGRVMGIHTIGYSLMPLGGLFMGYLADRSSAELAVVIGNSIYLLAIVMIWLFVSEIRRLDGRAMEQRAQ
jgi:MFS family permease